MRIADTSLTAAGNPHFNLSLASHDHFFAWLSTAARVIGLDKLFVASGYCDCVAAAFPPHFPPFRAAESFLHGVSVLQICASSAFIAPSPSATLASDQHPDHDTIAAFRQEKLTPLAQLFVQVLQLCRKRAGLVKLGHVALDGTKIKYNASLKHKAMSYERMEKGEKELAAEVQAPLAEAARGDAEEDGKIREGEVGRRTAERTGAAGEPFRKDSGGEGGAGTRGERGSGKEAGGGCRRTKEREKQEGGTGMEVGGRPPQAPNAEEAKPDPKAQRNFTDPESRIMKDGATKEFVQAYNAQAVVDSHAQVIVVAAVTQEANDKKQLVPMLKEVKVQMGIPPRQATADNGYFSETNVTDAQLQEIDLLVAPDGQNHGEKPPPTTGPPPSGASVAEQMRQQAAHRGRTGDWCNCVQGGGGTGFWTD